MNKIVVTTGYPFTDIDSLACAIAYGELLNKTGKNSLVILPGKLNSSITKSIKSWDLEYETNYKDRKFSNYILVDISDPEYFAKFVNLKKVIEVYDHRSGFEKYWAVKLGKHSHIELIGSCSTLIWEQYKLKGLETKVSTTSANLLYTAIASNTLNFKAQVTTPRDIEAFNGLKKFTNLPNNWIEKYFTEQDKEKSKNIISSLIDDTKDMGLIIGQLELWDAKRIVFLNLIKIEKAMNHFNNPNWFVTAPSISEGINYIYTKNEKIKKLLEEKISAKFDGNIGTTDKLWLRKEIWAKINKQK